jgi:ribose 1,5-bisphosphokinase PhnN
VIGPSGAGKSTLAGAFAEAHGDSFQLVRTHTTRPRRPGETGTHVFLSRQDFDRADYLGTLELFGARYGLPRFGGTRTALIVLRQAALAQLAALFPQARIIQVEAPPQVLVARLEARGDRDRADPAALDRETRAGRAAAHAIVRTDQPFARALADFTGLALDG